MSAISHCIGRFRKRACHFEGWYANREIQLFQWSQKIFGIVSIQVNCWIVPGQHIGGFQYVSREVLYGVYGSRRYQKFIEFTFLILIQGNSVADKRPRTILQSTWSFSYSAPWLKKNLKKVSPRRGLWNLIPTWLKNSHTLIQHWVFPKRKDD